MVVFCRKKVKKYNLRIKNADTKHSQSVCLWNARVGNNSVGSYPSADNPISTVSARTGAMNGQDGESLRQGESLLMIPFRLFV